MAHLARAASGLAPLARSLNPASAAFLTRAQTGVPQRHKTRMVNFDEIHFGLKGFNQYGMLKDDTLRETEVLKEALKRMPDEELDARNFRITRALQCTVEKTVLPKEQWTTYQDHLERGNYLSQHIKDVENERQEIADWNKQ